MRENFLYTQGVQLSYKSGRRSVKLLLLPMAMWPSSSFAQANADIAAQQRPANVERVADDAKPSGLEDIVVTAQRYEQRLQDVPLAVSAVSAESLARSGVTNILQMTGAVPSLTVTRLFGVVNLYMRGVGSGFINVGGDPGVAFHQDGVYIGRPRAQVTGFIDVDHIEVLRGPQGTLYGRNATAGAINVIVRKPTDELKADARLTVGNYDLARFEGGIGGPIAGDTLSARVAISASRRSGYGENIVTGHDIDNLREIGGRLSLRFTPSSDFEYLVMGDYYKAHDRAFATHYFGSARSNTIPTGERNGIVPSDIRDYSSETDPRRDFKAYGVAGIGTWQVSDDLTLKSTTAYRKSNSVVAADGDGSSVPLIAVLHTERARQITQEFQSTFKAGPVTAVGGLFYYNERIAGSTRVDLFYIPLVGGSGPGKGETNAYAAYGQLSYTFFDRLTLHGALRYSKEHRESSGFQVRTPLPVVKRSWDAFTPRFTAEYKFNPDIMVYASATKGFKSGVLLLGGTNPPVNPETLWSYEAGMKAQFLDNHLQTNLAVFHYDYKNLQVSRSLNTVALVENAASARIRGA